MCSVKWLDEKVCEQFFDLLRSSGLSRLVKFGGGHRIDRGDDAVARVGLDSVLGGECGQGMGVPGF